MPLEQYQYVKITDAKGITTVELIGSHLRRFGATHFRAGQRDFDLVTGFSDDGAIAVPVTEQEAEKLREELKPVPVPDREREEAHAWAATLEPKAKAHLQILLDEMAEG